MDAHNGIYPCRLRKQRLWGEHFPKASSGPESSAASEESTPSSESTASTESTPQAEESSQPETEAGSNALVVYFSWSGNTESVANEIQAQTGADMFEIVPAEPYTDDYDTLLDIAQDEQANDARPAIAGTVDHFEQYDVVYLGYPNWWGDMPMILYTFLDEYDFSGKTIAPFVTSGGSGFSGTIGTIERMEPNAAVTEGFPGKLRGGRSRQRCRAVALRHRAGGVRGIGELMTELEKMIKGAWYDTRAPELRRMSNRAKDLMRLYNSLPAENGELREEIIRLLLGKCGVNVRINQPFFRGLRLPYFGGKP